MNIIRMTGGLGNQMFAYALYLKFLSMGTECLIDDYTEYTGHENRRPLFLKDAFGINYPVASRKQYNEFTDSSMMPHRRFVRMIRGRQSREYHENDLEFDPKILTLDDAYLTGYFQSDKYFADIKNNVIKSFAFTSDVKNRAKKIIQDNGIREIFWNDDVCDSRTDAETVPVSIHVRRGDYLKVSEVYGGICTDEYYEKAIKHILKNVKNPVFLIFSNDAGWCHDWMKKINDRDDLIYHVIEGTDESTGYIDMYLMSRCAHNIIANSSFSWWAAYLNQNLDKIIMAPSRWQGDCERHDIYTDDMIRVL
ncbi:MAG: alpha-1,2-fucosyltransferase [Lachnospiraceae bacterium]|nr:alpha-1,2-fucosyltransferase [Lachnospiraceae bacterium]